MELNSQINTFTKGLDLDTDITMLQDGQYRYAENIRLLTDANGTTGTLQNIEHIRQYNSGIPADETILGTAVTRLYDENTKGTIECGIVLTKKQLSNGNTYNVLYKVTDFDSINIKSTPIVKGYLELENNVSIVTNYESDKVSNVYISDGLTPIKVINICEDNSDEVSDPTRFDITPGCVLLPFNFINTVNGALPAGSIQYCYQLFNLHGPETATSSLSQVIPITGFDTAGSSQKIYGQLKGTISGRGCKLSARFMNDGRFDRARIFSIIYLDNISVPDIYIINEIEIPMGGSSFEWVDFTYIDNGASFLSKITIDEFNAMIPYEFNAKSIEKMGNRLFASNVQELTWDVEYDARAYRCNSSGQIILDSSNITETITGTLNKDGNIVSNGQIIDVPKEHDCINPSNVSTLNPSEYKYYYDGSKYILGGKGPNVTYEFIFTEIVPSSTQSSEISTSLYLTNNVAANYAYTYDINGNQINTKSLPSNERAVILNYADPYISSNYLGYQRDEIYRFGVIFYNRKNIPSPVHWIGDIRMPSIADASSTNSLIYPFHLNTYSRSCGRNVELVAYALGIKFTLSNIGEDVLSYEIVRCDRNEQDRTIVTQGIVGNLFKFVDWSKGGDEGNGEMNISDNDTRPAPMFSLVDNFQTMYHHEGSPDYDYWHTRVPMYFEFVSPEICISKDTILQNIMNGKLCPLYKVDSEFNDKTSIPQSVVYTTASTHPQQNDVDFGTVVYHDSKYWIYTGHGANHSDYYGYAGVFKYYNNHHDATVRSATTISDAIIGTTLPFFITLKDSKSYVQYIGDKSYVNTSIGGYRQFSNHGVNAVLKLDQDLNVSNSPNSNASSFCTALIANIKQSGIPYGGNTYISRQNSIYQSCGCFTENMASPVFCYGGDTYLCVLDYLNTSIIQEKNDSWKAHENRLCCVCYIPLESQANLNLRSDDSYHRTVSGSIGQNYVQNEPIVFPDGYVQDKPYYEYNPVYSSVSGSKQYIAKGIYAEDNQISNNRIVVSEMKTNNEITDSWTKFKFANYLDVDSQYGQITNLKTFNNKLYFWQDNAVGIASVNERSLITDNNMAELTLGTGGILTRFDYVATLNGSSIVNDKSIVNSASTIYWYDFDKNEICAMNSQGLQPISKLKSVQSYLNTLSRSAKDNSVSFYDKKYNEVWFRIYDKSLIYNEQLQVFTSFYTHNPNWFFPFSDKLVTIKDNNMYYLHNIYEVNSDLKEERVSKIEFVVNKDISNTKVFDNVIFTADLLDNQHTVPEIVKDIIFKTKTQETSPIQYNNIEIREDNYRFSIPREKVDNNDLSQLTSQSYLGRMRGKYLICNYTFDCNNNREFKLPYIKTTYRYSML